MFNKGDIIIGRATRHPIVFLENIDNIVFRACIITHANDDKYPDNIKMDAQHFEEIDNAGNEYKIQYDDTYCVSKCLIKRREWGPFVKEGELTEEGIEFIDNALREELPITWEHYIG